ncbi:hypothetical protein BHE74_00026544 [Ensete ventricosum]|nr:hypothetical protein BHE74_00026544 [Ensete ventricosum]
MPRPTAIQAPAPKKLTRDELRERSAKELCWHCEEPWSREHHCKKGRLLVIEPVEDEDNETFEEALEPKEEAMEEESQPANYAVHTLVGYSNPLMIAPTKEPKLEDMTLEPKEKDTPQPATHMVPTLDGYTNLQKLKIEGFLEQQSIIILIDAGSTHNFMSNAPPWPSGAIALTTMMLSTPNRGQMFIIGADTSIMGVSTILMQDG